MGRQGSNLILASMWSRTSQDCWMSIMPRIHRNYFQEGKLYEFTIMTAETKKKHEKVQTPTKKSEKRNPIKTQKHRQNTKPHKKKPNLFEWEPGRIDYTRMTVGREHTGGLGRKWED